MRLEVLIMASLSCDQNLENKGIYCISAFWCQPSSGTIHIRVGSGREADGTSDQLLIWFGSLVASLGALQVKVGLKGVFQLGQFAHWAVLAEILVWAWP